MKKITTILLCLLSFNCFSAQENFKENQDKIEKEAKSYMSYSYGEYPKDILQIAEKKFNKSLKLLFPPKAYESKGSLYSLDRGYLTCFTDESNNLYSTFSKGSKILKNSLEEGFNNQTQASYCDKYLNYSKAANESVIEDKSVIDENGLIKYKNDSDIVFIDKKPSQLVDFIIKNKEKYKNEVIESDGITYLSNITLQGINDDNSMLFGFSSYDADNSETKFNILNKSSLKLIESCSIKGSFIGQNAFGVKKKIQKQNCNGITLELKTPLVSVESKLKISADQYRALKNQFVFEVDLTVKESSDGTMTHISQYSDDATISNPFYTETVKLKIYAEVRAMRVIIPGTKEKIEVFRKTQFF